MSRGVIIDGTLCARFRADPARVRVAVRREGHHWYATVVPRDNSEQATTAWNPDPKVAVMCALRKANFLNYPGIDLGMDHVYDHPHGG